MADRIRANPTGIAAYNGAGPGASSACLNNGPANCATPAVLAAADTYVWQQAVLGNLPGGAANVTVANAGVATLYTISVSWTEPGSGLPLNYVLSMQL
jgi:hypothetical protein